MFGTYLTSGLLGCCLPRPREGMFYLYPPLYRGRFVVPPSRPLTLNDMFWGGGSSAFFTGSWRESGRKRGRGGQKFRSNKLCTVSCVVVRRWVWPPKLLDKVREQAGEYRRRNRREKKQLAKMKTLAESRARALEGAARRRSCAWKTYAYRRRDFASVPSCAANGEEPHTQYMC